MRAPDPMSPYGSSKLMTEIILRDTAFAHPLKYAVLRYFNVAGADPQMRTGQSTPAATHLIKVAVQTALGMRKKMDVFGTDYPTPDGTCIRDYIHVSDLVRAHSDALRYLRAGGDSATFNCGYGRGFSVFEVIDTVKRVSGVDFRVELADRRPGDPARIVAASDRARDILHWVPRYDDLPIIVRSALEWEQKLRMRNSLTAHKRGADQPEGRNPPGPRDNRRITLRSSALWLDRPVRLEISPPSGQVATGPGAMSDGPVRA